MRTKHENVGWKLGKNTKTDEEVLIAEHPNDKEDWCIMPMFVCFMSCLNQHEKTIYALIWTAQNADHEPYFSESMEYVSSWLFVSVRQVQMYIKRMLENGHICEVASNNGNRAFQIVEDDPARLEAIEFMKDPVADYERWEEERAKERAAKRAAKKAAQ